MLAGLTEESLIYAKGMEINIKKNNLSFIVLIIVLSIYSVLIISSNHYERLTADSTIYFDIAKKYMAGNYKDAVNGYWGPLLSWLFIPFLYFGASHVFTINAINLIVGLLTLFGTWVLSYRFELTEKVRSVIMVVLLPVMLLFSIVEVFDFLLACFIIFYLGVIFNNEYPNRIYKAVLCGVFGALAYFCKSYAFPFFLVHFLTMNILHFIRSSSKEEKHKVLRNAVTGFVVFAVICTPWIAAISSKYGHITFSNTGKGNFAPIGPEDPKSGLERGVPIFHKGLFAPPNNTATSVWEDPSYIWKDIKSWSPFDSAEHFKYFISNIVRNVFDTLDIYESFSRLALSIIVAYFLLFASTSFNKQLLQGESLYSFITVIIYSGGYLPFHLEHRYLWTVNILLLLMGGYILSVLFKSDFFNKKTRENILIAVFAISFMITPLKSFGQAGKGNINKEMYMLSNSLKDKYNIHGNIASNREWQHIATHDSWHKSFRLSYWLDSKYYGQTEANIDDNSLISELEKFNIDYYVIWGQNQNIPQFLSKHREVTNGSYPDLKIYSLKETNN